MAPAASAKEKMSNESQEKVTVLYSIEEGWIHYIRVAPGTDLSKSSFPCTCEITPYSEAQMRYLRGRAKADPNIYIFQAKRDQP